MENKRAIHSQNQASIIWQVWEKAEEMRDLRNNHFKAIKEEKDAEAKQASDEIEAKVNAWKDKWYKELENK